ncbi:hypothetical protein JTT00_19650 [Clostridium botulinum]|nr:hypothetical protein CFSAN002369_21393 [Clostridium botulinum CFSAN002369]EPS50770.1 hypothetical protein CFSAN002367_09979 [Clostridium botulinum CFSAN002367]MCS4456164.1 hypothetical protein [Clostridium botulinum]MCS4516208.1 hypothetical protein [Clostridium botulinum]
MSKKAKKPFYKKFWIWIIAIIIIGGVIGSNGSKKQGIHLIIVQLKKKLKKRILEKLHMKNFLK